MPSSSDRVFRVLVRGARSRTVGGTTVYEDEWIECDEQQAMAYVLGDPAWRSTVEPQSSLFERFRAWWLARA